MAKRNLDMGNLRLKTTELEISQPRGGLLTPISAGCCDRRFSVSPNDWSFSSESSTLSQPLSASSVQFSQEHALFSPNEVPLEFGLVESDMSNCGMPIESQGIESNWMSEQCLVESINLGFQNCGTEVLLPSGAEILPSLGTGIIYRTRDVGHSVENPCKGWFPQCYSMSAYDSREYRCPAYPTSSVVGEDLGLLHDMPVSTCPTWISTSFGFEASTIVPVDMLVEELDSSSPIIQLPYSDELSSPSPARVQNETVAFDLVHEEDDMPDAETENTKRKVSKCAPPVYQSRSGAKRVKEPKRKAPNNRRKPKSLNYSQRHNGKLLKVPIEMPRGKRHECSYVFPDDQYCGKKFARVEHLRRHLDTHTGTNILNCPDPDCVKRFKCRADNLREHYKTHLKKSPGKRNTSRSFEEFFGFLRAAQNQEEAEKAIAKLMRWKDEGGHLQANDRDSMRIKSEY